MLLMSNLMLLYGSVQKKPHLLLPWVVTTSLATVVLLVYTAIKWKELEQFRVFTFLSSLLCDPSSLSSRLSLWVC